MEEKALIIKNQSWLVASADETFGFAIIDGIPKGQEVPPGIYWGNIKKIITDRWDNRVPIVKAVKLSSYPANLTELALMIYSLVSEKDLPTLFENSLLKQIGGYEKVINLVLSLHLNDYNFIRKPDFSGIEAELKELELDKELLEFKLLWAAEPKISVEKALRIVGMYAPQHIQKELRRKKLVKAFLSNGAIINNPQFNPDEYILLTFIYEDKEGERYPYHVPVYLNEPLKIWLNENVYQNKNGRDN